MAALAPPSIRIVLIELTTSLGRWQAVTREARSLKALIERRQ